MMLSYVTGVALKEAIERSGAAPAGIALMLDKAQIYGFKLRAVRSPAANIIKQELLAVGAECVVPAGVVNCALERADIITLGTRKQYRLLATKLKQMPYWQLPKVAEALTQFFQNTRPRTVFPSGQVLEYNQTVIMGIINVTPDSFYAGSRTSLDEVLTVATQMLQQGAAILDIGGESTRPGATSVSVDEELARVVPVVEKLHQNLPQAILSIDTYHSQVAEAALGVGAALINDISGGTLDSKMLSIAKRYGAPIVLMHGRERLSANTKANLPRDIVAAVSSYLQERIAACVEQGIASEQIILDPGIGFGKDTQENLTLLRNLSAFTHLGYPVLVGASRKSFIADVVGAVAPEERLAGTLATSCVAIEQGAHILRVHDVAAHSQALRMMEAMGKCHVDI